MKSRVVIARIECYEKNKVRSAIDAGVRVLGGWERFIKKEEKILLKPNLLAKAAPERACTTHPVVFSAVAESLLDSGYEHIKYGDSSGNHLIGLAKTAEGCGLKASADRLGIGEADFSEGVDTPFPEGTYANGFVLCKGVLEAEAIVNLCKMKTHQLERITGAVKNTFGCVYGFNKGVSHVKFPNADAFGGMLADLNRLVRPRIHIMDGITAMEGNGPQSGTPVDMNVILLSDDPVALDTVFCHLVRLDPSLVPTNTCGQLCGVGQMEEGFIEIYDLSGQPVSIKAAVEKYGKPDFDVFRGREAVGQLNMLTPFRRFLEKRPVIDKSKCVKCGICVRSCPLGDKAVAFEKGETSIPRYDYKKCIKCWCCQEMCPEKAIYVKTPKLGGLAERNWKL